MIIKIIGDDLTLTSNSEFDLARLPPRFSNFPSHIYRVNYRLTFQNRVDEPFIKAPNPYDGKQGWLKNPNNVLKPIYEVIPILASA